MSKHEKSTGSSSLNGQMNYFLIESIRTFFKKVLQSLPENQQATFIPAWQKYEGMLLADDINTYACYNFSNAISFPPLLPANESKVKNSIEQLPRSEMTDSSSSSLESPTIISGKQATPSLISNQYSSQYNFRTDSQLTLDTYQSNKLSTSETCQTEQLFPQTNTPIAQQSKFNEYTSNSAIKKVEGIKLAQQKTQTPDIIRSPSSKAKQELPRIKSSSSIAAKAISQPQNIFHSIQSNKLVDPAKQTQAISSAKNMFSSELRLRNITSITPRFTPQSPATAIVSGVATPTKTPHAQPSKQNVIELTCLSPTIVEDNSIFETRIKSATVGTQNSKQKEGYKSTTSGIIHRVLNRKQDSLHSNSINTISNLIPTSSKCIPTPTNHLLLLKNPTIKQINPRIPLEKTPSNKTIHLPQSQKGNLGYNKLPISSPLVAPQPATHTQIQSINIEWLSKPQVLPILPPLLDEESQLQSKKRNRFLDEIFPSQKLEPYSENQVTLSNTRHLNNANNKSKTCSDNIMDSPPAASPNEKSITPINFSRLIYATKERIDLFKQDQLLLRTIFMKTTDGLRSIDFSARENPKENVKREELEKKESMIDFLKGSDMNTHLNSNSQFKIHVDPSNQLKPARIHMKNISVFSKHSKNYSSQRSASPLPQDHRSRANSKAKLSKQQSNTTKGISRAVYPH